MISLNWHLESLFSPAPPSWQKNFSSRNIISWFSFVCVLPDYFSLSRSHLIPQVVSTRELVLPMSRIVMLRGQTGLRSPRESPTRTRRLGKRGSTLSGSITLDRSTLSLSLNSAHLNSSESDQLRSTQFQSTQLSSPYLNSIQLSSSQSDQRWPTQLQSTQLNSAHLPSIQLNSTQSDQLWSTQFQSTQLNSTHFTSVDAAQVG